MGKHLQSTTNFDLGYRHRKLSMSAGFGRDLGKNWNENSYGVIYSLPQGVYKTSSYYQEHTNSTNVANYRLGLGYEIDRKTDVSVQFDGLSNLFNLAVENQSKNEGPAGEITMIDMYNNGKTKNTNNSANINLNRKLDTLGSSVFFGAQYNSFQNILYDQINERITYNDNSASSGMRINDGHNGIDVFSAQADVVKVLGKGQKAEFGGKYYAITNESRIVFRSKGANEGDWKENQQLANSFLYNEKVPAAYFMYSDKIDKFSFNIGSRAELSNVYGFSRKLGQKVFDTTYVNLFPGIRGAYELNSKWRISTGYGYRINRPVYQDIDPFVWYIDSLTSIRGNSGLKPEYVHAVDGSVSYKSFVLKLGYAHANNAIRSIARTGGSGVNSIVFTKENMQHYDQWNASLEIPFETKSFNSFTSFTYNLNKLIDARPGYISSTLTPLLYIYTYNQLTMLKFCNIDISGEYYGVGSDGMTTKKKPYYYLSLGVSRTFADKRLSLQLTWNDFLKTARNVGEKRVGVISNYYSQRFNTYYLRLTVSYKLGGLKNAAYRNKQVNTTEFNRIKQ